MFDANIQRCLPQDIYDSVSLYMVRSYLAFVEPYPHFWAILLGGQMVVELAGKTRELNRWTQSAGFTQDQNEFNRNQSTKFALKEDKEHKRGTDTTWEENG